MRIEKWIDQRVGHAEIARRLGCNQPVVVAGEFFGGVHPELKTRSSSRRQCRAPRAQQHADIARAASHLPYRMEHDHLVDSVL